MFTFPALKTRLQVCGREATGLRPGPSWPGAAPPQGPLRVRGALSLPGSASGSKREGARKSLFATLMESWAHRGTLGGRRGH